MLVHRLKVNASVKVGDAKITNCGGSPCVIGIEGPVKVKLTTQIGSVEVPVDKRGFDVIV